jgi:hypothetical protein
MADEYHKFKNAAKAFNTDGSINTDYWVNLNGKWAPLINENGSFVKMNGRQGAEIAKKLRFSIKKDPNPIGPEKDNYASTESKTDTKTDTKTDSHGRQLFIPQAMGAIAGIGALVLGTSAYLNSESKTSPPPSLNYKKEPTEWNPENGVIPHPLDTDPVVAQPPVQRPVEQPPVQRPGGNSGHGPVKNPNIRDDNGPAGGTLPDVVPPPIPPPIPPVVPPVYQPSAEDKLTQEIYDIQERLNNKNNNHTHSTSTPVNKEPYRPHAKETVDAVNSVQANENSKLINMNSDSNGKNSDINGNSNGAQIKINELLKGDLKSKSISELLKLLANLIRAYGMQIMKEFGKSTVDLMLENVKKTPKDRTVLLEAIKDVRDMILAINNNSTTTNNNSTTTNNNLPASLLKNANSIALVIDARDFGINVNQLKQLLMQTNATNTDTTINPTTVPPSINTDQVAVNTTETKMTDIGVIRVEKESELPRRKIYDPSKILALHTQDTFGVENNQIPDKNVIFKRPKH